MARNVITLKNLIVLLLTLISTISTAEQIFAQTNGHYNNGLIGNYDNGKVLQARRVKFVNNEKKEIRVAISAGRSVTRGIDWDRKGYYEFVVVGWYIIKPGETRFLDCGHGHYFYFTINDEKINKFITKDSLPFAVHPQDRFLMIGKSENSNDNPMWVRVVGWPIWYDKIYWGDPQGGKDYSKNATDMDWEDMEKQGWKSRIFIKVDLDRGQSVKFENDRVMIVGKSVF
ncbi:MAG: hypothetical protein LBG58_04375 [Planctomycetaceae bacterium]|jgi:hypothetical protein|nr:hypothetical protein [Planctomycetaceae bacterium]